MNLRHIDEFLEKHSAGWKPFSGDFRLSKDSLKSAGQALVAYGAGTFAGGMAGGSGTGAAAGSATAYGQVQKQEIKKTEANTQAQIAAAKKAAHDAEVAQLAASALGTVNLRRRRGSMATMLTGSSMGGNPTSTGKTLLSQ